MDREDIFEIMQTYFMYIMCVVIIVVIVLSRATWRYKIYRQVAKIVIRSINYTPITYLKEDLITPVSVRRLSMVRRKTLILDMDETLITSVIVGGQNSRRYEKKLIKISTMPFDYNFQLPGSQAQVYVCKRPHVDFFLDRVSQWYDLVIFTAGTEPYASRVLDFLDAGRKILNRRLYRHNCINICGVRAKFVSLVNRDMASVLLLDDCDMENNLNVGNSVRIKRFRMGTKDEELLCMLPFLDALRFTRDVRSVLERNIARDHLTSCLASHVLFRDSDSNSTLH